MLNIRRLTSLFYLSRGGKLLDISMLCIWGVRYFGVGFVRFGGVLVFGNEFYFVSFFARRGVKIGNEKVFTGVNLGDFGVTRVGRTDR